METISIPLTHDKFALIDADDWEKVSQYQWRAHITVRRGDRTDVYAAAFRARPVLYLHRLVMDARPGQIVDHINGNHLDCRKENLRFASAAQNSMNASIWKSNTSGYKGVYWCTRKRKWIAQICGDHAGKKYLGSFKEITDAADAYDRAAIKYFGEFARTNAMIKEETES